MNERDEFENPLLEAEDRQRRGPRRPVTEWEKQAASWNGTTHHFTCCGTTYGAMTAAALGVTRQVHNASPSHIKAQPKAPIVLGANV